jgi:Flp pilus assembly protein TadG
VKRELGRHKIRRFFRKATDTSGSALVEFALLGPVLIALAIFAMDFGLYVFSKMQVQEAAQAGAQYVIGQGTYNAGAISTAVTNASRYTSITASSSNFCGCPSTSGVIFCAASCGSCDAGTCATTAQGNYVTVTATPAAYKPLISFGSFSGTYNISATSTVRIR